MNPRVAGQCATRVLLSKSVPMGQVKGCLCKSCDRVDTCPDRNRYPDMVMYNCVDYKPTLPGKRVQ